MLSVVRTIADRSDINALHGFSVRAAVKQAGHKCVLEPYAVNGKVTRIVYILDVTDFVEMFVKQVVEKFSVV